jgi:serine/threonine-protein phosphatase PGAM5
MAQYRKILKTIFASASIVGTAVLVNNVINENRPLKASWTNNFEPSVKWEQNWDKREPSYLVKPKRHSSSQTLTSNVDENNNQLEQAKKTQDDSELNKHTAKARRHIFLIRHGQYESHAKEAHQMILTQLGNKV